MSDRAHVEATLRPLLALFTAACGQPVAFYLQRREGEACARYALAADGALVATRCTTLSPTAPVSAEGLRIASHWAGAQLEATSLGGRAFSEADRDALEACAQLVRVALAPHGDGDDALAAPGAMLDEATGLPNRAALTAELERMLARAQRDDMTVFAVCVALAGFDGAVTAACEAQLRQLGQRLAESVRGGDLVARTAHREFAVVGSLPRATAEASAAVVLERLQARCAGVAAAPGRIDLGFAIARIGEFDAQAVLAEAEAGLLL